MIKEIFIDTETTGTAPDSGIWQIAGIIRYEGVYEEFNFKCDIFNDDFVDEKALLMHGLSVKALGEFDDPGDVYQEFITLLDSHVDRFDPKDKFFFIGYGAEFDAKMLRRWFEGFGDQYFGARFFHPWICVMTMAAYSMREVRFRMPNFQLKTALEFAGIPYEENKLHDALYDIKLTMMLYDTIRSGVPSFGDPKKPGQWVKGKFVYMDEVADGTRKYRLENNKGAKRGNG